MTVLTAHEVHRLLNYDAQTGNFHWRVTRTAGTYAGDIAGSLDKQGYIRIRIGRRKYAAHRLAWFYTHGNWPSDQIDHINRNRADNRLINLREVDNHKNQTNVNLRSDNTSGVKGVCWHKASNSWMARITVKGQRIHLGIFELISDAISARLKAEERYGYART